MSIFRNFWVTKKYPVGDKVFHFFIGLLQINMLNTLESVSGKKYGTMKMLCETSDRWVAVDGDTTYIIEKRDDRPDLPIADPYSIQDLTGKPEIKKMPKAKQLTFI